VLGASPGLCLCLTCDERLRECLGLGLCLRFGSGTCLGSGCRLRFGVFALLELFCGFCIGSCAPDGFFLRIVLRCSALLCGYRSLTLGLSARCSFFVCTLFRGNALERCRFGPLFCDEALFGAFARSSFGLRALFGARLRLQFFSFPDLCFL
jgi:hypothetical protein